MTMSTHVKRARARLLLKSAFFGTLIVTTPTKPRPGLGTACTDMRNIFYDPDWFEELPLDHVIGVLAHEVLHIALEHGYRRNGRDPEYWNYACDYAINLMLIEMGFKLPPGLLDTQYKGMSAEQIYDLITKGKQPQPSAGGSGDGRPQSDGKGGVSGSTGETGRGFAGGDLLEPAHGSAEAEAAARRELRGRIVQAVNAGRMAGQMPASLLRAIEDIVYPGVPWEDLLRPQIRATQRHDETWQRRNRRFADVYLPSTQSNQVGKIVVIGDTSGSITNDDMKKIAGTVVSLAEDVNPLSIHVIWADAAIAGEQVFEQGDHIALEPVGGGGTDMRVPLARAAELEPELVVLVTDGYTPWPSEAPDYDLVVLTTSKPSPHGVNIKI